MLGDSAQITFFFFFWIAAYFTQTSTKERKNNRTLMVACDAPTGGFIFGD